MVMRKSLIEIMAVAAAGLIAAIWLVTGFCHAKVASENVKAQVVAVDSLVEKPLIKPMPHGTYSSNDVHILIDKPSYRLFVVKGTDTLAVYPCALGRNYGQKLRSGDCKTPEGIFTICSLEPSSDWGGDASGSDYGPWFFRLKGGVSTHIGIHGTNKPNTVGTRASLGCIRLHNEDLLALKNQIKVGTVVEILPDTVAPTFKTFKASNDSTKKYTKKSYGRRYYTYHKNRNRYKSSYRSAYAPTKTSYRSGKTKTYKRKRR